MGDECKLLDRRCHARSANLAHSDEYRTDPEFRLRILQGIAPSCGHHLHSLLLPVSRCIAINVQISSDEFCRHCAAIQTSWHYFWALLVLYGLSVVFRGTMILVNKHKQRFSPQATIRLAAPDLLMIRVRNTNLHWSAGQHLFFRFTGVNFFDSWQSHPFTICSVPTPTSTDVVAVARVRNGQIKHLTELQTYLGEETQHLDVWLDGPYGDPLRILPTCDRILLLGGGSGTSR